MVLPVRRGRLPPGQSSGLQLGAQTAAAARASSHPQRSRGRHDSHSTAAASHSLDAADGSSDPAPTPSCLARPSSRRSIDTQGRGWAVAGQPALAVVPSRLPQAPVHFLPAVDRRSPHPDPVAHRCCRRSSRSARRKGLEQALARRPAQVLVHKPAQVLVHKPVQVPALARRQQLVPVQQPVLHLAVMHWWYWCCRRRAALAYRRPSMRLRKLQRR